MKPHAIGSSMRLYRRLLQQAWPYKAAFVFALLGMVVAAATEPATAAMIKPLLDGGFVEKDPSTIRWVPPVLIALFLARGIGNFTSDYAMGWIGRRIIFDMRNALFGHMLNLPAAYYDANASGVLVSKVIYDVEQIATAATKAVVVLIKDSLTVIGLLGLMIYRDWQLTLMFAVVAPFLAWFVRTMSRRFRKTSRGIQTSMGDISNVTQEITTGHRVVKAFNAQEKEVEAFNKVNEINRRKNTRKAAIAAASVPIMELLAALAMALVVYYALMRAEAGALTAGAFASYFLALTMMMNPAKRLTKVNETLQTGLAAAQSVFDLLDQEAERDRGTVTLDRVNGRVEYRNVSFRYAGSAEKVLDDVSFIVQPGETLALVGNSGSGKSTTANLLPRFYAPESGSILLDGVDIATLALRNLREHLALVSQETVLFNDSLRNNIAYGSTGPLDERRLDEVMRAAHVAEFVDTLPEGLDTVIGEKGVRLSGGQRQRLAIARALYKNAPILVLDEATSALDSESERFVQEAMQALMRNRTTLVIAHRLSTIENADKIVVLAQGRVVEVGTHRELLAKNGVYATLYHTQFERADGAVPA